MRFDHRNENMFPRPANSDFTGRNCIQQKPVRYLPECFPPGQILRHHDQVVPEIQKHLS